MQEIEITEDDIKLIRHLVLDTNDEGHVEVNGRYPFGNEDPVGDIIEILGWDADDPDVVDDAFSIYSDMEKMLAVFLGFAELQPGRFRAPNHSSNWERV